MRGSLPPSPHGHLLLPLLPVVTYPVLQCNPLQGWMEGWMEGGRDEEREDILWTEIGREGSRQSTLQTNERGRRMRQTRPRAKYLDGGRGDFATTTATATSGTHSAQIANFALRLARLRRIHPTEGGEREGERQCFHGEGGEKNASRLSTCFCSPRRRRQIWPAERCSGRCRRRRREAQRGVALPRKWEIFGKQ